MILSNIAEYVNDRISSDDVAIEQYITTDSLLQNKSGRGMASNLPPETCTLTRFEIGDVLVANIRPYLKKVWKADIDGGASADVLVFRAKSGTTPEFLYAVLMQDSFYDFAMLGAKGTKMPRGDKAQMMRFPITELPDMQASAIGQLISNIESKITLNRQINHNLEALARQLYDYWFVQFDFPDENGKPYKSNGGKMEYNEKIKRTIPRGWSVGSLLDIAIYTNGLACQRFRPLNDEKLPVIKIKEMHDGISADTEWVRSDIPESVKVYDGDVLFSWSASLEVMLWAFGTGGLNQHIFKVTSKNGYPRSFYYYQLLYYIEHFKKMAEARKTTMGHITQDHLRQSTIVLPINLDIINKFDSKIKPILDEIVLNNQQIVNLIRLRDELLPLLMNGQATVNYDLSAQTLVASVAYS